MKCGFYGSVLKRAQIENTGRVSRLLFSIYKGRRSQKLIQRSYIFVFFYVLIKTLTSIRNYKKIIPLLGFLKKC